MMKIVIGSDHAGVEYKAGLKAFLEEKGFDVEDKGPESEESVDYPDFAEKVARAVADKEAEYGVLVCGTGIGMSMSANKVKGIRSAVIHNEFTGKAAKEHNNANVVCVGARVIGMEEAQKSLNAFFEAEFEGDKEGGERHKRRVGKIMDIEEAD